MKQQGEKPRKDGQPQGGQLYVTRHFQQGKTGTEMVRNLLLAHRPGG